MNKMNCIIVDDEPIARKILREFVDKIPFIKLAAEFENAIKADEFQVNNKVDLIFLDIEMPKKNGIQYLKEDKLKPLIILTTAYPEYALEGYGLNIIDYLLKPIAFERFLKAVQKAQEYIDLKEGKLNSSLSYFFVRSEKRIEKIELRDILYIESTGNYVNIYTEDKKIVTYLTLKGIESQLPPDEFIKIHQSFLVGFSKIDAIEGNQIRIKGKMVTISRNYKSALMDIVERRLLKR
jgi:DNA-binding LytR/AlgR family response regulator